MTQEACDSGTRQAAACTQEETGRVGWASAEHRYRHMLCPLLLNRSESAQVGSPA